MGVGERGSDVKSQLVGEICAVSSRAAHCARRHRRPSSESSPFIDWYLVLRVEEDAGSDVIRKQYCKLALLLHPDKNKHPKAEFAFKLISEAYKCLSDDANRRVFKLERLKNFCSECHRNRTKTCHPSGTNTTKAKQRSLPDSLRSSKILKSLEEIRERMRVEINVMENCLNANAASRDEFPVFDPSDYMFWGYPHCRMHRNRPVFKPSDHQSHGYPHLRSRNFQNPEILQFLQTVDLLNYKHRRGKCEYPVFEIGPEMKSLRNRSVCLYS